MSVVFDNVQFTYPGVSAGISDINLTIADGEFLSVIGPSGSGKSTLLRLLSGFLIPQRGRIYINGEEVTSTPAERRSIGLVFQSYALFPHMSVANNIAYPLKVRGVDAADRRRRAEKALERVGLGGFANRSPATLSGGQQQRVALARAMVFSPVALLLDEPLSALDASLRASMRDEIRSVQREADISTLFVTHDQEEALSMSDRVAVMFDGRIAQIAAPRTLYDHPSTAAVAAFVGKANVIAGKVTATGEVSTRTGLLRADTAGFLPGDRVTALIRPEKILPAAPGRKGTAPINAFAGHVVVDRFLGPVRHYDFKVGEGMLQGETRDRDEIRSVYVPPEAILLFPESEVRKVQEEKSL